MSESLKQAIYIVVSLWLLFVCLYLVYCNIQFRPKAKILPFRKKKLDSPNKVK